MVVDTKRRRMNPTIALVSMNLLCGCFGVTIYGIAIHFVYRFFALERRGRVRFFQNGYLVIWFVIPLFAGLAWLSVTSQLFASGPLETEYIRDSVRDTFDIEIEDCVYSAGIFYLFDESGTRFVNWKGFIGLSGFLALMSVPFTIIVIFGFKSWKIVKDLLKNGESEYSKNLQIQLYKALVAQTVIPMFLLFLPFGLLFVLPIFEIDCQFLAGLVTLIFAIYPAIDPLPILYFIEYYRNPVIDMINQARCKGNRVSVDRDGSVTIT
uniref:Seven TM Receptor n=1 Tax=Caenorhabditis tropicalis TaxID=1561998 RepID=A0A1I7TC97_9PELO